MGKAGGKTQLGLGIAVALVAVYIGSASVFMHKAFHNDSKPSANTTTTAPATATPAPTPAPTVMRQRRQAAPPPPPVTASPTSSPTTAAPATTAAAPVATPVAAPAALPTAPAGGSGSKPTPAPTVFTGSYAHATDTLEDAHGTGMALQILAYISIGVSVFFFIFDSCVPDEKMDMSRHRWWISSLILLFSAAMIGLSGYVTYESARTRPSLVDLKETQTVRIDPRQFYGIANTTDAVNDLCYNTMQTVTNQYDSAKDIVDFKGYHLAIFVTFALVMGNLALQQIKALVRGEKPKDPSDMQKGVQIATHYTGSLTFILVVVLFLLKDGRKMFDKGAGSWNPGIEFANTSMTDAYASNFTSDEASISAGIDELINRFNNMPEMIDSGKASVDRDTIASGFALDVGVENAFVAMCMNATVFRQQGDKLCQSKLDGDSGLYNRRTHFIFASILYAIAGVQCIVFLISNITIISERLKPVVDGMEMVLPPYEVLMVGGAFALVTHLNVHAILTNCDVLDDTHAKDAEGWYGLYASVVAFSLLTGILSTTSDTIEQVAEAMNRSDLMARIM